MTGAIVRIARRYTHRDEAMARAFATGVYTMQEIAAFFGVHYSTVSRAVRRLKAEPDCNAPATSSKQGA
ncbi:helix-turn-helix domain-containing protein [Thioalkalicoccus limnaeus]|uniref:Helix-turn-helix domain-containing protein n=1 Tax=Thioalkalicoccus limnaeus TaxID=120681 RepID=A0ABV4BJ48_9GAMM